MVSIVSALRHIPWRNPDVPGSELSGEPARTREALASRAPAAMDAPSATALLDLFGGRSTDELLLDLLQPPMGDAAPVQAQQWFRVLRDVRAAIDQELQKSGPGDEGLMRAAEILDEVSVLNDLALDYMLAVQPG